MWLFILLSNKTLFKTLCMFSYDMAIPDEILMLVCLYQVQMYMFLLRNKSWKPKCSGATYLMVKDAFHNAI